MSTPERLVAHRDNPYFGLEFYDAQYGAWFFGRETESDKVAANLQAARLTVLHAESGVGKSSLLRAGVAWRMGRLAEDRAARHRPVRFVPVVFSYWKGDPVADLADAIGTAIKPYLGERPPPRLPTDQLDAAIEETSGALNTSLLIMLDQFEEYFLYRSREPVPERFADQLARCVTRTDLRANFLIALREDAYASLGDLFKGRITNVYGNYLHIDYLDRASAEQAIREPLAVYNAQRDVTEHVTLQPDLVQTVLNELLIRDDGGASNHAPAASNGDGRVSTPLLQLVMERIWDTERAEGSHELRLATLQKLRGVRMIADTHLTNALDSLGGTDREIALDMFDHLVTPTGGKIAESVPDLAQRTGHSEAEVGGVLAKLDGERIVRSVPAAPGQQDPVRFRRYEIFHDVLAAPINRAIGAQEERRRTRRIRRFGALAIALLLVVTGVAIAFAVLTNSANDATQAANNATQAANKEKLTAESRQLAAEAAQNDVQDPALSTELALQALQLDQTNEAQQALRAALPGIQAVGTIADGSLVNSAAFNPANPNEVASADSSGMARMWNVQTGKTLFTMSLGGFSTTGSADAVAFNPSGSEVAVGFANGNVAVFNAGTGKEIRSAEDDSAIVYDVEFLGNTGEIAIASQQNTVLWRYTNGTPCCEILSSQPATAIATAPAKPQELAVATENGIAIIDVSGQKPRSRQLTFTPAITASFNRSGTEVVSAEDSGDVAIYDVGTGSTVAQLVGDSAPLTASFSWDGKRIVAGYASGTAIVWDIATKLPMTVLAGNAGEVYTTQFSTDGSEVVTAGADGTIRVWYAQPRELRTEFTSPTGSGLLYGADYLGDRILDLEKSHQAYMFTPGGVLLANVTPPGVATDAAAWDRSGSKIVVAGADGTVEVLRATGATYTPVPFAAPVDTGQGTYGVAITPDGSRMGIVTDYGYSVEVRNADTGAAGPILTPQNAIEAIDMNQGGDIVGADYHGQVELWTSKNANPRMLGTPGPELTYIAFSHSGNQFVTVSAAGAVTAWDTNSARVIRSIENPCPAPSTAAFNPSGSMIVVGCGDGTVRVFDVASGQSLLVLQATTAGVVAFADFSPDGKSIIATVNALDTGFIQVWNAELATTSLSTLEQIARQRVTQQLTPAQRQEYMPGL
jgi:WD40 repeat protein